MTSQFHLERGRLTMTKSLNASLGALPNLDRLLVERGTVIANLTRSHDRNITIILPHFRDDGMKKTADLLLNRV